MATQFTIRDLAKEFDLTTRAIRFYEDMGLLRPERHGPGGRNRIYSARERARLRLTLRAKRLGLSLTEAKDIIDMYDSPRDTVPQLQKFITVLTEHRKQLELQMQEIQANLDEVKQHEREAKQLLVKHVQRKDGYMSNNLTALFENNRSWAQRMVQERPGFFEKLARPQSPKYLWIGCSDSRVPANEIIGLDPGEVFVHRNVANVVVHSDLNALSVIQYAVDALKVEHIMVVGHYGCGGVLAAARGTRIGLADNWLRHVSDVHLRHRQRLNHLPQLEMEAVLCEMNVIEQVGNVALSNVMQDAWSRGQKISVHGWVYGLNDGLVKDLNVTMSHSDEVVNVFRAAFKRYPRGT